MSDSAAMSQEHRRVRRLLADVANGENLSPLPELEVPQRNGRASVRLEAGGPVISYPELRAQAQPDSEVRAILAHEINHITGHDLKTRDAARRDVTRVILPTAAAVVAALLAVVAVAGAWDTLPLVVLLGTVAGYQLGLLRVRRLDLRRDGIDAPAAELAADLGAARLVGAPTMAAALQRPTLRSRTELLSMNLARLLRCAYPTHPPLRQRLQALSVYDGVEDPREFAKRVRGVTAPGR